MGEKVTYLIVRYFAGIIPPLPWILVKDVLDDKRIPRISLVTKSLTILRNEVTSDSILVTELYGIKIEI